MDTLAVNQQLKNDLENNTRSLFLSALAMSSKEAETLLSELAPTDPRHHLRFALFLLDYFYTSNGTEFCSQWTRTHSTEYSKVAFKKEFDTIYPDPALQHIHANFNVERTDGADKERNLRLTKSKCWILAGTRQEEAGNGSDVWNALRDAIKYFKATQGRIELFDGGRFPFLRLLFSNDTIERREYIKLVEYLASGTNVRDLGEPWNMIVTICEERLGSGAYVDWYLQLTGDEASFGVGFDSFPFSGSGTDWRDFKIDGDSKHIEGNHCWFNEIPWDHSAKVDYKGLSESDGRTPLLFAGDGRRYEVFVHYISDKRDWRSHWWRRDSEPTMTFFEKEFLVCARNEEDLTLLPNTVEPNDPVQWEIVHEGQFKTKMENGESILVPYRRYRLTNRPEDADGDIFLADGTEIKVKGKAPAAVVFGNEFGIRLDGDYRNLVVFPDGEIRFSVDNARQNCCYRWTVSVDDEPIAEESGEEVSFRLADRPRFIASDGIRKLEISCNETNADGRVTKRLERTGGVVLPDAMKAILFHDGDLNGWTCTPSLTPIADHLEGYRKVTLAAAGCERPVLICIPQEGLAWWFEEANFAFFEKGSGAKDSKKNTAFHLPGDDGPAPFFSPNELVGRYLCVLPKDRNQQPPEGWSLTALGYWKCEYPLIELVKREACIFNEDTGEMQFRFDGEILFRFKAVKPAFCQNAYGHVGLFVPETDRRQYVVVAHSDASGDFLCIGKTLAQTNPEHRFTDVQDGWSAFLAETDGWDAILVATPVSEKPIGLLNPNAIAGSCSFRSGGNVQYAGDQLLGVILAKATCERMPNLPLSHPVCRMRFKTQDWSSWNVFVSESRPWNDTTDKTLRQATGTAKIDKLVYWGRINNNVPASGWDELDAFANGCSPVEFLGFFSMDDDKRDIFTGVLDWMADGKHRRVGRNPSPLPTDREWLFCAAAAFSAIRRDGIGVPFVLKLLGPMFSSIVGNPCKRDILAKYIDICSAVLKWSADRP